jgi:NADH-quinone oxidoreductase subunit M
LNRREFAILAILAVAVLLLGLWPAPLLDVMRGSTHHLVEQMLSTKLPTP